MFHSPTSRQNQHCVRLVYLIKTRKAQATSSLTPERKVTPITYVEGEARENTTCAVSYLG